MIYIRIIILFFLVFTGCSSLTKRPFVKNTQKEEITRSHDTHLGFDDTKNQSLEIYPWEKGKNVDLPKITKEFFRCKGSFLNPLRQGKDSKELYQDCEGPSHHTLPLLYSKEVLFPVLLDILNYIQNKTHKRVVITCAHRCPIHNKYVDDSLNNKYSPHMIGAEVDFYVEGLEKKPQDIVNLIFSFYKETPGYRGKDDFEIFQRYDDDKHKTAIYPWFNKEILITLYNENEGRDFDNRHPYPYLSIQVLYDRQLKKPVLFSMDKAIHGYKRF